MKSLIMISGIVLALHLQVMGRTLTYDVSRAGAWTEPESWVENMAPAAGDTLVIPGDAYLRDADAAAVASVNRIKIAYGASLTVENENQLEFGGFVSGEGSLVKCGAGTCVLSGRATFTGRLDVREGKLDYVPRKFTWYKFTIRESLYGRQKRLGQTMTGDVNVALRHLTFYDENVNDISTGHFTENTGHVVANLKPGEMTYDGDVIQTFYPGRNLGQLVDGLVDGDAGTTWMVLPKVTPTQDSHPETWFSIVFRFPADTPQITSYDVHSFVAGNGRTACAWLMAGSDDGVNWLALDDQFIDPVGDGWMSNGADYASGGSRFALENPGATDLSTVESIDVAQGATLSVGNSGLPLRSPLKVKPNGTYGRFEGFVVPEEGTVNIDIPGIGPMSWFRFTVLETNAGRKGRTGSGYDTEHNVAMHELALYDASGVRRNLGLRLDSRYLPEALQPGYFTYSRSGYAYYTDRDADKLFDDSTDNIGWCVAYGNVSPRQDKPETHIVLTMRLMDENPNITSYDLCEWLGSSHDRSIFVCRLEGSMDGKTWVLLDERTNPGNRSGNCWWFDGAEFEKEQVRAGWPITTVVGDFRASKFRDFACAIDLSACVNVSNLKNWSVRVSNVEVPKLSVIYGGGVLRARNPGLIIYVR